MTMMKRYLSIATFILLLITGYFYLNRVFSSSNLFVNTEQDFKELSAKTNIDLLFYGSSHTFTAYNPLIFNKICETISFNLGSDAQRIFVTDLVLEESLKHTSPKLVVLEVYVATLNAPKADDIKGFQLRALDFVSNLSPTKLKRVQELYDSNEYLGVVSPLIRNHKKWDKISLSDLYRRERFDKNWAFYYGGFLGAEKVMNKNEAKGLENFATQEINKTAKKKEIDPKALAYLDNFISIAQNNGAEVLIVSSPDVRARSYYYPFFDQVTAFCEKKEVKFLNLNDYYLEMGLTIKDFKDVSHLNNTGAIKASTFLANYIQNNFNLENRSSDPVWKDTMSDYNNFEEVFMDVEDETSEVEVLDSLITSLFIESIEIVRNKSNYNLKLNFDSSKLSSEDLDKYNISINVFPFESDEDKINEASKKRGWIFEKHDFKLTLDTNSPDFTFNSGIKNIKRLELFVYNSVKYEGAVGKKVVVKELNFTTN